MNTQGNREITVKTLYLPFFEEEPNYQSSMEADTKESPAPEAAVSHRPRGKALAGQGLRSRGRRVLRYTSQKHHQQDPNMAVDEAVTDVAASDFPVLEEKILKTIELVKSARAAQAVAERDASRLREQLEQSQEEVDRLRAELIGLRRDREEARSRVEKLIHQIDHLIQAEPEAQ